MKEYFVLTMKDKLFSGKFDPQKLQAALTLNANCITMFTYDKNHDGLPLMMLLSLVMGSQVKFLMINIMTSSNIAINDNQWTHL